MSDIIEQPPADPYLGNPKYEPRPAPAFTGADVGAACVAIRLKLSALAAAQRGIDHETRISTVGEKQIAQIEVEMRRLIGILAMHADSDLIAAAAAP